MGLIVKLNGSNARVINSRLVSASIVDEVGAAADTATLTVVANDTDIADINARIGFFTADNQRFGAGDYSISSIRQSRRSGFATIHCRAFDVLSALQIPKQQSFSGKTLDDIVISIANEFGLLPIVSSILKSTRPAGAIIDNESPLEFLQDIANKQDAILTIKGGRLIITTKDTMSASGKSLLSLQIDCDHHDIWWDYEKKRVDKYNSVIAKYLTDDGISTKNQIVDSGSPAYSLPFIYPSKTAANSAAKAALKLRIQKTTPIKFDIH